MIEDVKKVDGYIDSFEGIQKERLVEIRSIIKQLAPEAIESLAYGLVGYKVNSKPLVYFGGFANHTGFYATPNCHEAFKQEFSRYKQGKGSVQFPINEELPTDLIRKVVKFRLTQTNDAVR